MVNKDELNMRRLFETGWSRPTLPWSGDPSGAGQKWQQLVELA